MFNISSMRGRTEGFLTAGQNGPAVFLTTNGGIVRYPNLRYGNPAELAYYAVFWGSIPRLAKFLRRDERTVSRWINETARVPWWVPEILRLKRMEAELRHQQMGMGKLAPMLGIVSADVIELPQHAEKKPAQGGLSELAPAKASLGAHRDAAPVFGSGPGMSICAECTTESPAVVNGSVISGFHFSKGTK